MLVLSLDFQSDLTFLRTACPVLQLHLIRARNSNQMKARFITAAISDTPSGNKCEYLSMVVVIDSWPR